MLAGGCTLHARLGVRVRRVKLLPLLEVRLEHFILLVEVVNKDLVKFVSAFPDLSAPRLLVAVQDLFGLLLFLLDLHQQLRSLLLKLFAQPLHAFILLLRLLPFHQHQFRLLYIHTHITF